MEPPKSNCGVQRCSRISILGSKIVPNGPRSALSGTENALRGTKRDPSGHRMAPHAGNRGHAQQIRPSGGDFGTPLTHQPPLPSNILQILLTTVPVKGRALNLPARPTWGSADSRGLRPLPPTPRRRCRRQVSRDASETVPKSAPDRFSGRALTKVGFLNRF